MGEENHKGWGKERRGGKKKNSTRGSLPVPRRVMNKSRGPRR